MPGKDQATPLAPASSNRSRSHELADDEEALPRQLKLRQRKYIQWCGCFTAVFLILAVTVIVLFFTVFRIRDPSIVMNSVSVERGSVVGNFMNSLTNGNNITFLADVSVKNPNVASFNFDNSTTALYYRGVEVGEARVPAGKARARRTLRMNLTVDFVPRKILADPNLAGDVVSGSLPVSSYTMIRGRVRILNVIKKFVTVKMNCTMTYVISTQEIQDQKCDKNVRF